MNNIGNTIRTIRQKKRISQKEFAKKCDISATYLSQIERGSRDGTIELLDKMSNSLNIPFPIISFLSLNENSIPKEKRDAYKVLEPAIKSMIEKFFIIE